MDKREQLDRLRERIRAAEDMSQADSDALLEFSDELFLRTSQTGIKRHVKLLRHCTRMAEEVGGLADTLDDRDPAEDIVRWINQTYDNEETNRDYRVALRMFGRRTTDDAGDEPPPSIDWVPSGTSSDYNPMPDPSEMLHWEEHVRPMIDSCHNNRDRALLAVAFDAGPRSGELKALTVGDVSDHDHGLQISVDGKQGQRAVTLIPAVPFLNRWLADHPGGDGDPLWCGLHDTDSITDRRFLDIFKAAAERTGVDRPVTPTNFRKSSASYLASRGMSQAHLEDHHGWIRGSDTAARYVAVFADAGDRELARIHGQDVSTDEPDPIGPVECPRCQRETPRDEDACVWCGQVLDPETAAEREERRERLRESIRNADDDLVDSLLDIDRRLDDGLL